MFFECHFKIQTGKLPSIVTNPHQQKKIQHQHEILYVKKKKYLSHMSMGLGILSPKDWGNLKNPLEISGDEHLLV
jgi:hypothetical protein